MLSVCVCVWCVCVCQLAQPCCGEEPESQDADPPHPRLPRQQPGVPGGALQPSQAPRLPRPPQPQPLQPRTRPQKRKTTTISVEVKKSQHKYIVGPKGNTLHEIMEATGVSVEMPPLDSGSETIILRGEPDKLEIGRASCRERVSSPV